MTDILLVLSTTGTPDEAIEFAVKKAAKEGARLTALYIVEDELQKDAFDRFSDIGFIGDRPSTELGEAVMKEYRQRGYEELGRVQIIAMEAAVDFDPITLQGSYLTTVLDVIDERKVTLVVTARRKRSKLSRYLKRSHAEELTESAPCKVIVFGPE
jgi:nucleotide-binding universal stress UspA family protein